MPKLTIDNLRYWIPSNIKKAFNIDKYEKLIDCVFLVHNISSWQPKLTFKWYRKNKKFRVMIKKEKWMNLNNLKKIWLDIKDNNGKKYSLSQNFYKTESNKDTWIEWKNCAINTICDNQKIKNLIKLYEEIRDINNAQTLIGGTRKHISEKLKTAENYFNRNFLSKIMKVYNTNNFTHNNKEGEEYYDKNGNIKKKYINEKLKKYSKEDLFKVCDYLAKFLDIFNAMLELGDIPK